MAVFFFAQKQVPKICFKGGTDVTFLFLVDWIFPNYNKMDYKKGVNFQWLNL